MAAELLRVVQEAVTALPLQAAGSTRWVEIAQLAGRGGGLLAILVGLKRMGAAGQRRDREIDERAGAFTQQGEAMTQAFTQQGQVLAELLRRPAYPRPIPSRAGSSPAQPVPDGRARNRAGRFARSAEPMLFPSTPSLRESSRRSLFPSLPGLPWPRRQRPQLSGTTPQSHPSQEKR